MMKLIIATLLAAGIAAAVGSSDMCICARIYQPICADGHTFSNPCLLDCENLRRQQFQLPTLQIECPDSCNSCEGEQWEWTRVRNTIDREQIL